jgi:hypothetical protein
MGAYVALLRAINVGGTGKLEMAELRSLCEGCGFTDVATLIQSGNVVFQTKRSEASVLKLLEQTLAEKMGRPVGVLVRSTEELHAVLERNPFPEAPPNRLIVFFLPAPRRPRLDRDSGRRAGRHARARGLCPLSARPGHEQAEAALLEDRNRPQPEHRDQAGRDADRARGTMTLRSLSSRQDARAACRDFFWRSPPARLYPRGGDIRRPRHPTRPNGRACVMCSPPLDVALLFMLGAERCRAHHPDCRVKTSPIVQIHPALVRRVKGVAA